ncbi:MAG: beta-lactamase family protein [Acidobacteriota bacterium]|nr:beta-lactamase family protein [Acidobacteriota bacterium]
MSYIKLPKLLLTGCLFTLFATAVGDAQEASVPPNRNSPLAEEFTRFAEKQSADGKFSGVVLVAKAGLPILEKASGFSDMKAKTANTLDTKFDLGSMPKMFTAVAIAQLEEAGRLSYTDVVGKYLPDYPNRIVRDKVTIHELLTHTAGLGNYFRPGFIERRLKTVPEYLSFVEEEDLVGDPGGQWKYSNSGYVVLGAIIEKASGQDFYAYVRDHIFKPAEMSATGYYTADDHVSNVAIGYTTGALMIRRPGNAAPNNAVAPGALIRRPPSAGRPQSAVPLRENGDMHPYRGSPAGGAYSTAGDMLRFINALNAFKLLSQKSLSTAEQGKVSTGEAGTKYGYGFLEWHENGKTIIGHGGGGPGVNGMVQFYPDSGYTVIVLSNFDPPAAETIAAKARELITKGSSPK